MYVCMHLCMYACMYMDVCVCVCVCVWVCVGVCRLGISGRGTCSQSQLNHAISVTKAGVLLSVCSDLELKLELKHGI